MLAPAAVEERYRNRRQVTSGHVGDNRRDVIESVEVVHGGEHLDSATQGSDPLQLIGSGVVGTHRYIIEHRALCAGEPDPPVTTVVRQTQGITSISHRVESSIKVGSRR